MALRKIAQLGEPILRQVARPLTVEELQRPETQRLIDDLIETMRDADGAGIAAPQVFESVAVCVIELRDNPRYPNTGTIPLTVLVNPVVTEMATNAGGCIEVYEGCLSVAGVRGRVQRPRRVRVQALDRQGSPLDFEWEGFRAAVVQHETDHLKGTLFVDRADPRTLSFAREYERYVPTSERVIDRGAQA